ncbi:hypothetical protein AB0F73_04035 [Micromonospora purpureochromogenes]|uniref:hypothetical protein n=1 Tax=Micromonospora purpureochromogenes TaxID=47872 RepID=UPI0033EC10F3
MNDRGDVVGRAQAADGTYRGFLWRHGRMIDLGAFNPTDVNDRGQVVGTRGDGSGGYVWHRGVLRPLGAPSTLPVAINNRGQVLGRTDAGPVLWTNGRARPVALGEVSDVNERGQVSGGVYVPGGFHAALWHSGRATDLGAGPFDRSNTYALNDRGWVIGWQFSAEQFERGILWRHGRPLDVGTLGGSFTQLRAINNRGEILASSQATDRSARPALWRRGVLHDLSLAGVSTDGEVVDLDDRGRIAATIRPVSAARSSTTRADGAGPGRRPVAVARLGQTPDGLPLRLGRQASAQTLALDVDVRQPVQPPRQPPRAAAPQ